MTAPIRYARSGDVNIAYQVTGDGPFDLVLVPGFFSHLEIDWEYPRHRALPRAARILRPADPLRQARHGPLRPDGRPARLRDSGWTMSARSWMRSDSDRAALFGYSEGGPMCVLFAATHPERTTGARRSTARTRSAATRTTTTRGRRPSESASRVRARARGDVGRERRPLDDGPERRRRRCAVVPTPRTRRAQPGRARAT